VAKTSGSQSIPPQSPAEQPAFEGGLPREEKKGRPGEVFARRTARRDRTHELDTTDARSDRRPIIRERIRFGQPCGRGF